MDNESNKSPSNYIFGPSALKTVKPGCVIVLILGIIVFCGVGRKILLSAFQGADRMVASIKATASATWVETSIDHPNLDARSEWGYAVKLNKGERVDVSVIEGRWSVGRWGEKVNLLTDGDGISEDGFTDQNLPVPESPPGALIGQFNDQQPFFLGNDAVFIAPQDGLFQLGINDIDFSDNIGALNLEIILYRMQ